MLIFVGCVLIFELSFQRIQQTIRAIPSSLFPSLAMSIKVEIFAIHAARAKNKEPKKRVTKITSNKTREGTMGGIHYKQHFATVLQMMARLHSPSRSLSDAKSDAK